MTYMRAYTRYEVNPPWPKLGDGYVMNLSGFGGFGQAASPSTAYSPAASLPVPNAATGLTDAQKAQACAATSTWLAQHPIAAGLLATPACGICPECTPTACPECPSPTECPSCECPELGECPPPEECFCPECPTVDPTLKTEPAGGKGLAWWWLLVAAGAGIGIGFAAGKKL